METITEYKLSSTTKGGNSVKHQKKSSWKSLIVTLVGVLLFCTTSNAQTVPQVAEKALAATVYLEMQKKDGTFKWGSGFFVRPNLIATNHHIIEGTVQGTAKLVGQDKTYTIEGITTIDRTNDLALLQVDDNTPLQLELMSNIKPLLLGDSDTVQIGDSVYVVGNPLLLEGTVSDGIISGRRDRDTRELLQMTAPISRGSSGGPVLNDKGEVIGISVSIHKVLDAQNQVIDGQNLNLAVPSNILKTLLDRSGTAKSFSQVSQSISVDTYLIWGVLRGLSGDHENAIVYYDEAIRLNPNRATAYYQRGSTKSELGQHIAAIIDYNAAIRLAPDFARAYVKRGNAKASSGRYFAAIEDYDTAIRLKPDYTTAYVERGIVKVGLGQYYAAVVDYNTTLRLDSDYAEAYIKRGLARSELGQHITAIVDYNIALRLKPDDDTAYYYRGLAKASLGRYFAAIADYDIVIHFKPDHVRAYIKRGLAMVELGQHFAAIEDYDTAIRLKPNYANAYIKRGFARSELGQHFAAIEDYNAAIRLKPNYANAYYNRGLAKGNIGSHWEAKQDLMIALKLTEQTGDERLKSEIEVFLQKLDR